jgi:hypothetical protein
MIVMTRDRGFALRKTQETAGPAAAIPAAGTPEADIREEAIPAATREGIRVATHAAEVREGGQTGASRILKITRRCRR